MISTEGEQRWPILSSWRPILKPGNEGSTRNAEIPFPPRQASVLAKTMYTPAAEPLVTQVLVPLSL